MSDLRPLREHARIRDENLAFGARLLASTPPLAKSEARKRRVWTALASNRTRGVGLRLSGLRIAFASVLFAAASSAAVGHFYVERGARPPSPAPGSVSAVAAPPPRAALPRATAAPQPNVVDLAPPPASTPPKPGPSSRRPSARNTDAELLLEAMRARNAGDAQRVSELVAAYRSKQPHGVLQEEALILSIEAAVSRRAPNAGSLAREYLTRFPRGRFAAHAKRALATDTR